MRLYYEDIGAGPTILLLHGFTGSSADWLPLLPMLPEGYRYIIPDQRGHGRSPNPDDSYTHRQSALDIFDLLNGLEINTFKACGMSGGAMALLHMATQQPERLESMVLVSPTTHYPQQAREIMGTTETRIINRKKHGFPCAQSTNMGTTRLSSCGNRQMHSKMILKTWPKLRPGH